MNVIALSHPFETEGGLAFDAYSSETNHKIKVFHYYNFNSGEGPSLISKTLLLNFIRALFHGRKQPRPLYSSEKN